MADNRFGFGQVRQNIRIMKVELPAALAAHAENFFVSSWDKQGWDGKRWELPQRRILGTKAFKYAKPAARTRATLVQSGALRRATANSIRSKTFTKIRLVVDLPYAAAHNDGNSHLPTRTFMKDSPILRVQQQAKIKEFADKIWKK